MTRIANPYIRDKSIRQHPQSVEVDVRKTPLAAKVVQVRRTPRSTKVVRCGADGCRPQPVFCIYTRKDYTVKSWTNRLKRLQRTKICTKSRLGSNRWARKSKRKGSTKKNV